VTPELDDLRAQLDAIDAEWQRTQKDKRAAQEELRRRVEAWDVHFAFLRRERARLVDAIRVASQRARGVGRRAAP
jgi:hypothetical protein